MENIYPVCQCCGMPLSEDELISREPDGTLNKEYCKWCYADGKYHYETIEPLLDFIVAHMPNPDNLPDEQRRQMFKAYLSELKYWKEKA